MDKKSREGTLFISVKLIEGDQEATKDFHMSPVVWDELMKITLVYPIPMETFLLLKVTSRVRLGQPSHSPQGRGWYSAERTRNRLEAPPSISVHFSKIGLLVNEATKGYLNFQLNLKIKKSQISFGRSKRAKNVSRLTFIFLSFLAQFMWRFLDETIFPKKPKSK